MNMDIYLSGPTDYVDNPESWRDEVKEIHRPDVEYVCPIEDWDLDTLGRGRAMVKWCIEQAKTSDAMLVGGLGPGVKTVGTWFEMRDAYFFGRPIGIYNGGYDLSENYRVDFIEYHSHIESDNLEFLVDTLRDMVHTQWEEENEFM